MEEVSGELFFKIGEIVEVRGTCFGERKLNAQEYTKMSGKLDEGTLSSLLGLMNGHFKELFTGR